MEEFLMKPKIDFAFKESLIIIPQQAKGILTYFRMYA